MVAGIPFPDIYDWTWGEVVEFISCKHEAETDALKTQARMDFKLADLISRMVMAQKGQKFELMEEYDFLWTDEERADVKRQKIVNSFHLKGDNNG